MCEEWQKVVDESLPRFDKEISIVGRTWMLEKPQKPASEIQAIMETEPNGIIDWDEDHERTLNNLEYVMSKLMSEEELAVIEVTVFAGHSIRKASQILGMPRSTVHRLKTSALERIKHLLENMEEQDEQD